MRKIGFFLFLSLLIMAVAFTSCRKNDNGNAADSGNEESTFDITFDGINADPNHGDISPTKNVLMADVLSYENKDKASSVKQADIQLGDCYIAIQGDEGAGTLKEVTVNVLDYTSASGSAYTYHADLTKIALDGKDQTNSCVTFLTHLVNYLVTNKSINVEVIAKAGDQEIKNLKISLHASVVFSW